MEDSNKKQVNRLPEFMEGFERVNAKYNNVPIHTVVFQYWAGNNPITGASIYADVTDQEIKIHYGRSWADMDQETREEIIHSYNNQ